MADLDNLVSTWDRVDTLKARTASFGEDYSRSQTTRDFDDAEAAEATYLTAHPEMRQSWDAIKAKRYPWHADIVARLRAAKPARAAAVEQAEGRQRSLERQYVATAGLPAAAVQGATAGFYDPLGPAQRQGVQQARGHATGFESVLTEGALGAANLAGTLAVPYAAATRLTSAGLRLAAPAAAEALGSLGGAAGVAARTGKMAADFAGVAAIHPEDGKSRGQAALESVPGSLAFGVGGHLAGSFAGKLLERSTLGPFAEGVVRAAGTAAGFAVPSAAVAAIEGEDPLKAGAVGAVTGLLTHSLAPKPSGQRSYEAGVKELHADVKVAQKAAESARASGQRDRILTANRDLAQSTAALQAHRALRETIVARANNPDLDRIAADNKARSGRVAEAHDRQRDIEARLAELDLREKSIQGATKQFPEHAEQLGHDLTLVRNERRKLTSESELLRSQEVEHSLVGAEAKLADGTVVVVETLGKTEKGTPTATVTRPDGKRQRIRLADLVQATPEELTAARAKSQRRTALHSMQRESPSDFNLLVNPPRTGDPADTERVGKANEARALLGMEALPVYTRPVQPSDPYSFAQERPEPRPAERAELSDLGIARPPEQSAGPGDVPPQANIETALGYSHNRQQLDNLRRTQPHVARELLEPSEASPERVQLANEARRALGMDLLPIPTGYSGEAPAEFTHEFNVREFNRLPLLTQKSIVLGPEGRPSQRGMDLLRSLYGDNPQSWPEHIKVLAFEIGNPQQIGPTSEPGQVDRALTGPPQEPGPIGTGLVGQPGSGVLNKQMTETQGFPGRRPTYSGGNPTLDPRDPEGVKGLGPPGPPPARTSPGLPVHDPLGIGLPTPETAKKPRAPKADTAARLKAIETQLKKLADSRATGAEPKKRAMSLRMEKAAIKKGDETRAGELRQQNERTLHDVAADVGVMQYLKVTNPGDEKLQGLADADLARLTEERRVMIEGVRKAEADLGSVAPQKPKGAVRGTHLTPFTDAELGNETRVVVGGEREPIKAHFAIVEGDTLQPSHHVADATGLAFKENENLPVGFNTRNYKSDAGEQDKVRTHAAEMPEKFGLFLGKSPDYNSGPPIVTRSGRAVLGGNGRTIARMLAHERGTDANYRDELVRTSAEYGADPAAVAKMKAPTLVRVVDVEHTSPRGSELVAKFNFRTSESQSPAAQAVAIGRTIPDEAITGIDFGTDATVSDILSGNVRGGRELIEAVFDALPNSEKSQFFTDKRDLTLAGKEVVQNAMLAKALPADTVVKAPDWLKEQITKALPQFMQLRGNRVQKSRNPLPQLQEALDFYINELDGGKRELVRWDEQPTLPGVADRPVLSEGARAIVKWLEGKSSTKTALPKAMSAYLTELAKGDGGQLFGGNQNEAVALMRGAFPGIEIPDSATIGPPPNRGESGMFTWGRSRNERRSEIRAHGGDIKKAEAAWRYRNLPDERPALAKKFRGEVLDETLSKLREGGLREDQLDIVRRLEAGEDIADVHKAVAPHLSVPQFVAQARAANARALVAADAIYGKGGLSSHENESQLSAFLRAWGDPKKLLLGGKGDDPLVLPTMARLRELGAERDSEGRLLRHGDISYGGPFGLRKALHDPWSNLPTEVANEGYKAERRLNSKLIAFNKATDNAAKRLKQAIDATPQSGSRGVHNQRLSIAEETLGDALDGLRRINGGEQGTPEQVQQFIKDRVAEFDKLSPGAGQGWKNAHTIISNMFEAVRREHKQTYGVEISPNILEGMYLSHVWSGDNGPTGYRRLPRVLSDAISSRSYSRFERARTGADGYAMDPINIARDYFSPMLKKMALDALIKDGSPIVRQAVGERTTLMNDIGAKRFAEGVVGGAIADNRAGRGIAASLNLVAKSSTNERIKKYGYLSIPSASMRNMRDARGNPLPGGGVAENGVYHFIRSGKPVGPGDTSIWLQPVSGGKQPIEVPLTRENLARMHTYRGGVLGLGTEFKLTGRLEATEDWLDRLKLGNEPRGAVGKIIDTVGKLPRTLTYNATLGAGQPKPALNNLMGGTFMATALLGAEPVAKAVPQATLFVFGHASERTKSLLRNMGVVEAEGVIGAPRPGSFGRTKTGMALREASRVGYLPFSAIETVNRAATALAGFGKFRDYADSLVSTLYGTHGIPGNEQLTVLRGKVYRADGSELPGGDRLAHILDGSKGRAPRKLSLDQINAELDQVGYMHGRAATAKAQFFYSAWFTPAAMQTEWGRVGLQLNQYPIRALMNFMDAAGAERNPARVARWLGVAIAASTAAHMWDRDGSSFIGPRIGDFFGYQDDGTWGKEGEDLGTKALHWAADLNLPIPMPFWSLFKDGDISNAIPVAAMAKVIGQVGYGALGLDPSNPLPDEWDAADVWSRAGEAWDNASRKGKSTLVPNQYQHLYDFASSPVDEQGRHRVGYADKPGYVTHMTPGEFASQELLPGSRKDVYDSYARGNARNEREGERDDISRAYRMNAVRANDPQASAEERSFAARQNEKLLAGNPHLANIDAGELARFKRSAGVSREVRDLMGASLSERVRGYFQWREAEHPGPAELRESTAILFGDTPGSFKSRFKSLSKEDKELALRLRGEWNRVMAAAALSTTEGISR